MRARFRPTLAFVAVPTIAATLLTPSDRAGAASQADETQARHAEAVARVARMPSDEHTRTLASGHALDVVNVMWEDTGRWLGSSVGPNISDVTIEVEMQSGQARRTALMPVLRHPNFSDKTGDVALDRIWIPVGNQAKGGQLTRVTLRDFLAAPTRYMSLPQSGTIRGGSLLAARDSHALVSAQATFLPIPAAGQATFWPVIFNYQSIAKSPAVLTLLVTRQGTSLTVVDNNRDTVRGGSGQRLFFNAEGARAPLTAERLSHVRDKGVTANGESADSLGADANLLMIVQVPLVVNRPRPKKSFMYSESAEAMPAAAPMSAAPARASREKSDVEVAVLGHGPELGPYTELAGLTVERDTRFPVRVTVQFYQATSNGVVAAADVATLAAQIDKTYASADYVGSLVVPAPADRQRPTNWNGVGPMPPGTRCEDFPGLLARGLCRPGQPRRVLLERAPVPTSAGIQ